jgi:hypothetical protein
MRTMLRTRHTQRGSVMVFVAVCLPVLALFAGFAIDVAHWYDYSRNLQNRADAAALAAGQEFGATCFGTPNSTETDVIGKVAQQYGGPPTPGAFTYAIPPTASQNVPYSYGSISQYYNQPNLTRGMPQDMHLLLNSSQNWDKGGMSWTLGTLNHGSSLSLCNPGTEDGVNLGPTVDVRITQMHVPLFFPLVGVTPNITARARIQIQGAGSLNNLRAVAVPDPGQAPCVYANILDQSSPGTPLAQVKLTETATDPPTWAGQAPAITVPAHQMSVQAFLPDDCSNLAAGGQTFAVAAGGTAQGIVNINTYAPLPAAFPAASPAKIGSVFLTNSGCTDLAESTAQDAYFFFFRKSTSCTVTVNAYVDFPPGVARDNHVLVAMDGNSPQAMTGGTADLTGHTLWHLPFSILPESGRHTFSISWWQKTDSTCKGANSACSFAGNPLQATYAAFNDSSDPPDDSGPITLAQVGDTGGGIDVNTLAQGSLKTLTVTFRLQGVQLSLPTDKPVILRTQVQGSKRTGAIDCGQGTNAAQALYDAISKGCPHAVGIYSASKGCVSLPSPDPITCADVVPGNKRTKVVSAFVDRVTSAPPSCDNWQSYKYFGTAIPADDPRIFTLVVTSPQDLSGGSNGPQVKLLGFAAFYVTGWDGDKWFPSASGHKTIPGCAKTMVGGVDLGNDLDEDYPVAGASQAAQADQIWGHFIKYSAIGNSNGKPCDPNSASVCVPALTR